MKLSEIKNHDLGKYLSEMYDALEQYPKSWTFDLKNREMNMSQTLVRDLQNKILQIQNKVSNDNNGISHNACVLLEELLNLCFINCNYDGLHKAGQSVTKLIMPSLLKILGISEAELKEAFTKNENIFLFEKRISVSLEIVINRRKNKESKKVNLDFERVNSDSESKTKVVDPVNPIADFNKFFILQKNSYKTSFEIITKSSISDLNSILEELTGKLKISGPIAKLGYQIEKIQAELNGKTTTPATQTVELKSNFAPTMTSKIRTTLEDSSKYESFKNLCNLLYGTLINTLGNCFSVDDSIEKLVLPSLLRLLKVSQQEIFHEYSLTDSIIYTKSGAQFLSPRGQVVEAIRKVLEKRFFDGRLSDNKLALIGNSNDARILEKDDIENFVKLLESRENKPMQNKSHSK